MANKRFNQITRVVTSFDSNDVLPVGNGTLGDGKMTGDQLLELTAQNALGSIKDLATTKYKGFMALDDADGTGKMDVDTIFNNFAGKFDPSKDYKQFESVIHDGVLRVFKKDHVAGSFDSTECWNGVDEWGVFKGAIPNQKFATSTGEYSYDVSWFRQQGTSSLRTPEISYPPLFARKGDVITMAPDTGLTITLLKYKSFQPFVYSTLKTVTSGTDSYKMNSDAFILIMVTKTGGGSITLSDFGATTISVKQEIRQRVDDCEISNFSEFQKAGDSKNRAKVPVYIPSGHGVSSKKRLVNLFDFASQDGRLILSNNDLYQSGVHVNSEPILVHKGDKVCYDGTSDSSTCLLTKKSGNDYVVVVTSRTSFSYTATEDIEVLYQIQNISLADVVYGNCWVERYMSVETLKRMQDEIDSSRVGFTTPFAKVIDGQLCVCNPILSHSRADYLAAEMPDTITKIACKWYWPNDYGTKGVVAMAVMPNTWNRKVNGNNGITGKSLHITCTRTNLKIDFLGGAWGESYYTNLINQTLNLDATPSIEHELSVAISGESVTAVIDGVTYTGTNASDKTMADVTGKFGFIEHFSNISSAEVDFPKFSAFLVKTASAKLYDTFARENGVCNMSPQGYPYINLGTAPLPDNYPDW